MSICFKTKLALSAFAFLPLSSYAENQNSDYFKMDGTESVTLPTNKVHSIKTLDESISSISSMKTIKLIKIIPSSKMTADNKSAVVTLNKNGGEYDYSPGIWNFTTGAVDIGMANVPVLDQGHESTCLIFAVTAALDARFNAGDYIDQQCILALNLGQGKDLWNGAHNTDVFSTLSLYGIIPKGQCFGALYPDKTQRIDTMQYMSASNQSYAPNINPLYAGRVDLNNIRTYINSGYRVLVTFALSNIEGDKVSVNGFDIKVNGVKKNGGLWACSQPGNPKNYCTVQRAYHEVVVTGYDDRQQLLKVRNSWGTNMGDNGEYYMTYGFLNAMGVDHTIVQ